MVHGLLQTLNGGLITLGTVFAIIYKLPSNNRQFWSVPGSAPAQLPSTACSIHLVRAGRPGGHGRLQSGRLRL